MIADLIEEVVRVITIWLLKPETKLKLIVYTIEVML